VRETTKLWSTIRRLGLRALPPVASAILVTLVSVCVGNNIAAQEFSDAPASFLLDYPPLEDPAFLEGLLSLLAGTHVPKGHFPPKKFSNVTDIIAGFDFAPYCYMPSEARRYSERLGNMEFSLDAYPVLLEQFVMECRAQIFVGKRGQQTAWIVVYDIPRLVMAGAPRDRTVYEKEDQHLLVLSTRAMFRDDFPAMAEKRALAAFNKFLDANPSSLADRGPVADTPRS
jgi:hypothetical protein